MAVYKIETTLFKKLVIPTEDGLYEEYTIKLDGKKMMLDLYIEEDFLNDDNIKTVTDMLEQIPQMYRKGKQCIWEQKRSNEMIDFFITWHLENLDGLDEIFRTDEEITFDMIAEKLEPRLIRIGKNALGVIDCAFDFSLPVDYADDLLVIVFNEKLEIIDMAYES